jgi:hypothetical protein
VKRDVGLQVGLDIPRREVLRHGRVRRPQGDDQFVQRLARQGLDAVALQQAAQTVDLLGQLRGILAHPEAPARFVRHQAAQLKQP